MKKLLLILFSFLSFAVLAQPGSQALSGLFMRVNDSTAYRSAAATRHAQGYSDMYWNNQASTPHFDIWNGSNYDHVFVFGGLPSGASNGDYLGYAGGAPVWLPENWIKTSGTSIIGNIVFDADADNTYTWSFGGGVNLPALVEFFSYAYQFSTVNDMDFYSANGDIIFQVDLGTVIMNGIDIITAINANTAKTTNATHTGEVTGATTLTVNKTAITNKTLVTVDSDDYVLIADASDSDNLKKVLASDLIGVSVTQMMDSIGNAIDTLSSMINNIAEDDGIEYRFGGDAGSIIRKNIAMHNVTGGSYSTAVVSSALIPNNSIISITVYVNGVNSDGSEGYGGSVKATFRKTNAGSLVLIGASVSDFVEDATGSMTIALSESTGNVQLGVTLAAGTFNQSAWGEYTLTTY